jgi:hypothetical protein
MDEGRVDDIARLIARRGTPSATRRRLVGSGVLVGLLFGAGPINRALAKKDKVTVCHNGHPITVAASALDAHLRHGDALAGPDGCDPTCSATYESLWPRIPIAGEICNARDLTTGAPRRPRFARAAARTAS